MPIPAAALAFAAAVCSPASLEDQLGAIAAASSGRVGAAVLLVRTGEKALFRGAERFPMQSVYKVPIVMAALHEVEAGRLRLDGKISVSRADLAPPSIHSPLRDAHPEGTELSLEELLRAAIVESDGTASDVLLKIVPPAAVTGFLRAGGLEEIAVATSERQMAEGERVQYGNWVTPRGAVELLAGLARGRWLAPESRTRLLGWMEETPIGARRIKGLLPPGTPVAHKTGLSQTVGGVTFATNDAGLITLPDGRRLAVAVFVAESRASIDEREAVIARIARAAWDCFAQERR